MTTPTEEEEEVITAGRKEGRKINYITSLSMTRQQQWDIIDMCSYTKVTVVND